MAFQLSEANKKILLPIPPESWLPPTRYSPDLWDYAAWHPLTLALFDGVGRYFYSYVVLP